MPTIRPIALAITTLIGFGVAMNAWGEDEDIRLVRAANLSLADAIEIAEARTGGRAFEAELDDDSFAATFEVGVAAESGMFEVRVSAESGEVLSVRADDDDIPALREVPLVQLVRTAERSLNGRAFEANCDDDRFDSHCEVELVTDADEVHDVVVSGDTGEVVRSRLDDDD